MAQTKIHSWDSFKTFNWFPFDEDLTILSTFTPQEITLPNGSRAFYITTLEKGSLLLYPKQLTELSQSIVKHDNEGEPYFVDVIARKIKNEKGLTVMKVISIIDKVKRLNDMEIEE